MCHVYTSGVFWWELSVCPRDGGSIMAQRGWEEVMEETLLSAEGFWHLLCSKGKGQGVCHENRMGRHRCCRFGKMRYLKFQCVCRHPETWHAFSSWIMLMSTMGRTTRASTRRLQTTAWCLRYAHICSHVCSGINYCSLICGTVVLHCHPVVWQCNDICYTDNRSSEIMLWMKSNTARVGFWVCLVLLSNISNIINHIFNSGKSKNPSNKSVYVSVYVCA